MSRTLLAGDLKAPLLSAATPQQQNCFDCGMFALAAAERLCHLAAAIVATSPAAPPPAQHTDAAAARSGAGGALLRAVEAALASTSQAAVTSKRQDILELVRQRADPSAQLP